ncbi:MAG: HD domain-containing protein [Bacilli bacterium]
MFEKVFNDYTSKFDFTNSDILLKYNHSYRVRNLCLKYASLLKYNKEDTRLAEFIGLYHDIGRFTQLKIYNTYDDSKSLNHADESINILFAEGLIDKFDFTDYEKEIIRFAIDNHNRLTIAECDDERMVMHAKLIRDCDKLDIVYLFGYLDELELVVVDKPLDQELIKPFYDRTILKYNNLDNYIVVCYFAYVFDLNNDIILKEFKDNLDVLYKRLNNEKVLKKIYNLARNYLEERINYVRD